MDKGDHQSFFSGRVQWMGWFQLKKETQQASYFQALEGFVGTLNLHPEKLLAIAAETVARYNLSDYDISVPLEPTGQKES